MDKQTRIYTAFSSSGLFSSTDTYKFHYADGRVLSNKELLDSIRETCPGVTFSGSTEVQDPRYTAGNIKAQKERIDRVLYFGSLPSEIEEIDIPKIAVHPLWSQWQQPYASYRGTRTLTAAVPIIPDASESVFSSRLETIARKISILSTVSFFRDLDILVITDKPVLGQYEPTYFQYGEEGRDLYEKKYLNNLHSLGASITVRPQEEMAANIEKVNDAEAEETAERWMDNAEDIIGTNREEITKSAKLYIVMKDMMEEYECNAVTTEGYGVFIDYDGGPLPSQGMPSSQFCTDGVIATSETLLDSLVTQQAGLFLTGFAGLNGDYVIDETNSKAYIGHCECPFNDPLQKGEYLPYIIRNLPQYPIDEQEKGGASVLVRFPADEQITAAKISVHDKKISLFSGTSVNGETLFPGWDHILCRTKLAVETDAHKLLENVDWKICGNHRVAFFGDYRKDFMDLAELMGYETVQKDR